jgi:hypothetical protein
MNLTRLSDTSPEVERRMAEAYRQMPPGRKWQNLKRAFRFARAIHAAGMRSRHAGISLHDIQADWIQQVWGSPSPIPLPEQLMEPSQQDFQPALEKIITVLEQLGIGYAVGGSIASSLHGYNRMTDDADITAEPFTDRADLFLAAFDPAEYYVSASAAREALRTRSTFNILHPASGYKIDLFIQTDEPFEHSAFARRQLYSIPEIPGKPVLVHSPEDIILFKLRWYRLGGEISDRQWNDILGVMRTQGERLDNAYLNHWSTDIGVKDLLDRIRGEVWPRTL